MKLMAYERDLVTEKTFKSCVIMMHQKQIQLKAKKGSKR